jgi:hypothetical protein
MSYVDDRPPYVDFSEDELRFIGRLARNLLACAVRYRADYEGVPQPVEGR